MTPFHKKGKSKVVPLL